MCIWDNAACKIYKRSKKRSWNAGSKWTQCLSLCSCWALFLVPLLNHPDTYLTSQESSQEDAIHERSNPTTYTSLQWPIQSRTWIEMLIVLIHRKIIPNRVTKSAKKKKKSHRKGVFIVKNEGNSIYLQKLKAELFLGMGELDQQTGMCFKLLVSSFKQHSWQSSSSSFMIFLNHPANYHEISKYPFPFSIQGFLQKKRKRKTNVKRPTKSCEETKTFHPPPLPKTLIPLTLLE